MSSGNIQMLPFHMAWALKFDIAFQDNSLPLTSDLQWYNKMASVGDKYWNLV